MTRIKLKKLKEKRETTDKEPETDEEKWNAKIFHPMTEAKRREYYKNKNRISDTDFPDNSHGFDRNYTLTVGEFEKVRNFIWQWDSLYQQSVSLQTTKFTSQAESDAAFARFDRNEGNVCGEIYEDHMLQLLYSTVFQKDGYFRSGNYDEDIMGDSWENLMMEWNNIKNRSNLVVPKTPDWRCVLPLVKWSQKRKWAEEPASNSAKIDYILDTPMTEAMRKDYYEKIRNRTEDTGNSYGFDKNYVLTVEEFERMRKFMLERQSFFNDGWSLKTRTYTSESQRAAAIKQQNSRRDALMDELLQYDMLQLYYSTAIQKGGYFSILLTTNEKQIRDDWENLMREWEGKKSRLKKLKVDVHVKTAKIDERNYLKPRAIRPDSEESILDGDPEWKQTLLFELDKIRLGVYYKLKKKYYSPGPSSNNPEVYVEPSKISTSLIKNIRYYLKVWKYLFLEELKLQKRDDVSAAEKLASLAKYKLGETDMMEYQLGPKLLKYFYFRQLERADDETTQEILVENERKSTKRLKRMQIEEMEEDAKNKLMEMQGTSAGHDYIKPTEKIEKRSKKRQKTDVKKTGTTSLEKFTPRSSGSEKLTNALARAFRAYEEYSSKCPHHQNQGPSSSEDSCSCDSVLALLNNTLAACNISEI